MLIEGICENDLCPLDGVRQEHFYASSQTALNPCDACGGPTRRVPSRFQVCWTGGISQRYRYREAENFHDAQDGFWATAKRGTADGKPKQVYLDTWQKVHEYAKSEGCADPRELGRNMQPTDTGKGLVNTCGMPGTEV